MKRKIAHQGLAAALAGLIVFTAMTTWDRFADVVWLDHATLAAKGQGWVTMRVTGYKLRECERVIGSEAGYVRDTDGEWHESDFRYLNDRTPHNSKPALLERQSFGLWRWDSAIGEISATMLTIGHTCADGHLVSTTMGPYPVD